MPAIRDVEMTAVKKSAVWFDTVSRELGDADKYASYMALRSVLHALREHLPREEAIALGEQLPLLIRGIFYEGWHDGKSVNEETNKEFMVEACCGLDGTAYEEDRVFYAVCKALTSWISEHTAMQIRAILPGKYLSAMDV